MLLGKLSPGLSRAIKRSSRGWHSSPPDTGSVGLPRSRLNMESPPADPEPAYLHQASGHSSLKCHLRSERGPVESRRSRIAARIERCRLIQRLFKREAHRESCVSCLERMPANKLVDLPCQHKYCNRCIRQMAVIGMADEQLFPPKCCSWTISSEIILPILSTKEQELFILKTNEYATPVKDRWDIGHKPVRAVARPSAQGVAVFLTAQETAMIPVCQRSLKWLGCNDGRGALIVVQWWNSYLDVTISRVDAEHSSAINAVTRGHPAFVSPQQRGQWTFSHLLLMEMRLVEMKKLDLQQEEKGAELVVVQKVAWAKTGISPLFWQLDENNIRLL
ncbi:hypothetical protein ETB97_011128 [Aspergillus alliaceus]|uniref:RING-type domain-containing protein n=1 Tax=Petromyces alliaceus TaxID=209559 RepID=A0A8H6A928_PETAA|nr:hypothetical protein ETB97_011128 [Aspergillus burnettii]